MVPGTLADTAISFAAKGKDIDTELLFHFTCNRMHIVADEPDRAR